MYASYDHGVLMAAGVTTLALAVLAGCTEKAEQQDRGGAEPPAKSIAMSVIGPDTSAVPVDLSQGWCGKHGVPESVCSRCNPSLVAKFKQGHDWCAGHGLPESQCTNCNPGARDAWAALNPANAQERTAVDDAPPLGPASSAIRPTLDEGWCGEHGVPESVCTRCGASAETFKEAGDWCEEHDLPESQCIACHPEIEAAWARLDPDYQADDPSDDTPAGGRGAIQLEPNHRLLTGSNDSGCQVDRLRVRFLDAATARKAGIEMEVVRTRRISDTIECPAEVGFDQTRVVRITPRVAGSVAEASVDVGQLVAGGDLLAVLESPALGLTKSRYIRMREAYLLAMADFERVDTIHRGTQRMLEVCTGSADSNAVRQALTDVRVGDAKSRLLQAHAALEMTRSALERERTLRDKKINSEQDFEVARRNLSAAEAGFQAAYETVEFDSERDRLAAMRAVRVAKSELDAAERELAILGLNDAQLAAIGSESGLAISRYALHSPTAGRVVHRSAVVGEVVQQQDALYTIADLSTMWLLMNLQERDIPQVRIGLPILFTVDGLPGQAFDGIVSWISNTVDDRTRTVKVRANLPNERGLLLNHMFGLARIIVHDNEEVVSVPIGSVQTDGCCQLVFVKLEDTLFEPRKVSLGSSANGHVEILAGLAAGETVVTVGSFLMKTEILKSNIGAGCCDVDPGR